MVATLIAMNISLAVPAEGPLVEEVAARARAAGDAF
jgi:hypothetical protein